VTGSGALGRRRTVEISSPLALTLAGGERDHIAPGSAVSAIDGPAHVDMAVAWLGL
jgi:hypothetical protein